MSQKYNVSEIFYTLQGSCVDIGRPSIFVRFSGCNLRCQWGTNKCDTPYTSWNPEVNMVPLEDLVKQITDLSKKHDCKLIVLTGGEPSMQNLELLIANLPSSLEFAVETNGTLELPESVDTIICSPKMSDSTPSQEPEKTIHERSRLNCVKNLQNLCINGANLYIKLVISKMTDFQEVQDFIRKIGITKDRVYLMPEGITKEDISENQLAVAELAKEHGYNFTTRLHVLLWGNTRGT